MDIPDLIGFEAESKPEPSPNDIFTSFK